MPLALTCRLGSWENQELHREEDDETDSLRRIPAARPPRGSSSAAKGGRARLLRLISASTTQPITCSDTMMSSETCAHRRGHREEWWWRLSRATRGSAHWRGRGRRDAKICRSAAVSSVSLLNGYCLRRELLMGGGPQQSAGAVEKGEAGTIISSTPIRRPFASGCWRSQGI